MKKRFIALMGLFVLMTFVLAGCGEKNQEQEQNQIQKENSQQTNNKENESNSVKGTFQELLGQGKKLKCEFSFENTETKMHGTAYTDGEKMYQEVFIDQEELEIETNVIIKDEVVYTWNSMQPGQGMKINLNDFENNPEMTEGSEGAVSDPNLNQSFDYKCEPWQVDNKKFEIPSDKNFMDMNSLIKGQQNNSSNTGNSGMPNPGNLNQQACDVCQYAPNPEECLKEMGC